MITLPYSQIFYLFLCIVVSTMIFCWLHILSLLKRKQIHFKLVTCDKRTCVWGEDLCACVRVWACVCMCKGIYAHLYIGRVITTVSATKAHQHKVLKTPANNLEGTPGNLRRWSYEPKSSLNQALCPQYPHLIIMDLIST